MSVSLTAFSGELSKIAESEESKKRPGYLRAVVAGLPVVAAQGLSDIPESVIERGVQNKILTSGGLPSAGPLVSIGGIRFASRIGAGALTTPVFLSGMKDITEAKNKRQERRGITKVVAAGGAYSALRGGIEMALDSEYGHLPLKSKIYKVVGPKALRGVASAAATGLMVGRSIKEQRKNESVYSRYVKPAVLGAGLSGISGLYEGSLAEGLSTGEARRRVGAKVGGKVVAGAAATLFLSELMKKYLPGKEKRAADQAELTATSLNVHTAAWAKGESTEALKSFYKDLLKRSGERSPSSRAALYAVHDELTSRGVQLSPLQVRSEVVSERAKSVRLDVATVAAVGMAPGLAMTAMSVLPQTDRDAALSDALDKMYVSDKINLVRFDASPFDSHGAADLRTKTVYLAKGADPSVLAHEIGHLRAGELRKTLLQNDAVYEAGRTAAMISSVMPMIVMASTTDYSYATKEELQTKSRMLSALGVVSAVVQTPTLIDEGIASAKGLRYLSNAGATKGELIQKTIKVLGPSLGTYAAPAVIPFVAAALLKKRVASAHSRREAENAPH